MTKKADEKITLKTPISRGDKQIKELILREPFAGDLRGLKLADIAQLDVNAIRELISRIGTPSLTKEEFARLSALDTLNVSAAVGAFFEGK